MIFCAIGPGLLLGFALAATPLGGESEGYEKLRIRLAVDSGQRHLELANAREDARVLVQAVEQFHLAVERGEGEPRETASKALAALKNLNPAFADTYYHFPGPEERERYREEAEAEHLRDRAGWERLANYAASHPDVPFEQAVSDYQRVVRDFNEILETDGNKRILIKNLPIPERVSRALFKSEGVILINGKYHLRNAFLKTIPSLEKASMVQSENVRILCQRKNPKCLDLLALGDAFCDSLREEYGAQSRRRLALFLFLDRGHYETCCTALGREDQKRFNGFMDPGLFTAILCLTDGQGRELDPDQVRSLVLHELFHLFHYDVLGMQLSPWYEEALAESYAAPGNFSWDGKKLQINRAISRDLIAPLLGPGGTVDLYQLKFLAADDPKSRYPERTGLFCVQSWAFLEFLRKEAGPETGRKLKDWVEACCSKSLDSKASNRLFQELFQQQISTLEDGFRNYLAGL